MLFWLSVLATFPFVCLSVCLSVCLTVCLSVVSPTPLFTVLPYTISITASLRAFQGQATSLFCEVAAFPAARYEWAFKGRPLMLSFPSEFFVRQGELLISRVRASHDGTYTCTASNDFGIVTAGMSRLHVIGELCSCLWHLLCGKFQPETCGGWTVKPRACHLAVPTFYAIKLRFSLQKWRSRILENPYSFQSGFKIYKKGVVKNLSLVCYSKVFSGLLFPPCH